MRFNYTSEAWEEEQMSNLGCESVSDLIAEVKRLREGMKNMLYRLEMEERDAGHAEQELEQWIDTWKHWLKEMIK